MLRGVVSVQSSGKGARSVHQLGQFWSKGTRYGWQDFTPASKSEGSLLSLQAEYFNSLQFFSSGQTIFEDSDHFWLRGAAATLSEGQKPKSPKSPKSETIHGPSSPQCSSAKIHTHKCRPSVQRGSQQFAQISAHWISLFKHCTTDTTNHEKSAKGGSHIASHHTPRQS